MSTTTFLLQFKSPTFTETFELSVPKPLPVISKEFPDSPPELVLIDFTSAVTAKSYSLLPSAVNYLERAYLWKVPETISLEISYNPAVYSSEV